MSLSKTLHLHFLCLDYICPGRRTIYLSTIFRMVFRHRRHDCGLRHMCLHLLVYGHRAMSLTGFYNRPMQSRRQAVRRSCGHISAAVHRNRTDIARRPCGFRTEAGQRSYGGCVILVYFWKIVYQTCTTTHFKHVKQSTA